MGLGPYEEIATQLAAQVCHDDESSDRPPEAIRLEDADSLRLQDLITAVFSFKAVFRSQSLHGVYEVFKGLCFSWIENPFCR